MSGWRLFLLVGIALVVGAVGLFLVFEPAPAESFDDVELRTSAVMASSASTGMGILVPKMALAAQVVAPAHGPAPILVAVAQRTKTPTPTSAPTIIPATREPTGEPTLHPTDVLPPTPVPIT